MGGRELDDGAVGVVDPTGDGQVRRQVGQAEDADPVVGLDLVVGRGVGEPEGEEALLLQVRLGDPGEGTGQDRGPAHEAGLHGGVLARAALAVVLVSHHHPAAARRLQAPGHLGEGLHHAVEGVDALAGDAGEGVHGPEVEVGRDVLEVAPEAEPRPGSRDVVGGALALGLEEQRQLLEVATVPGGERLEQLEALAVGSYHHLDAGALLGRGDEAGFTGLEALGRQLIPDRLGQPDAVHRAGPGVEVERAGQGEGHHRLGGGDEGEGVGAAVVALGEVAVVRRDDGVGGGRVDVVPLPLADAGAAGVGQDGGSDGLEVGQQPVPLDGGPHSLGAWRDQELGLDPQPGSGGLPGDRGGAGDVLVGGVGAAADERRGNLERPAVPLGRRPHLGHRVSQVRRVRAVDERGEAVEVDL